MNELVLVIEDEQVISGLIRRALERDGYRVICEADGDQGLARLFGARPDAVVLDLMLPGRSGLEILRELRDAPSTSDVPVIVLTARSAEMDKLLGFEYGADDYLTKPFSPREMVARVRALLRRASPPANDRVIEAGSLRLDLAAFEATLDGRKLLLARREFDLLAFLARYPGEVHSREVLLRKVWGYDYVSETRTVDVHVRRLRAKLGPASVVIETVMRVGYRFNATPAGETPPEDAA